MRAIDGENPGQASYAKFIVDEGIDDTAEHRILWASAWNGALDWIANEADKRVKK